jgi:hypothetical protein
LTKMRCIAAITRGKYLERLKATAIMSLITVSDFPMLSCLFLLHCSSEKEGEQTCRKDENGPHWWSEDSTEKMKICLWPAPKTRPSSETMDDTKNSLIHI